MESRGSVAVTVGTLLVLIVMTVALGVPTALVWTAKRVWKPVVVCGLFAAAVQAGLVGSFEGPLGLPRLVFWPVAAASAALFAFSFVYLSMSAWASAYVFWRDNPR